MTVTQTAVTTGEPLLRSYVPIVILLVLSLVNAGMMVMMSHMMGPIRPTRPKREPYESGIEPISDARRRFSVKFYLVGILFILFDIETIFLIPWAVAFRSLGLFGFIEGLLFILTLLVGLIYAWKKGALEWD